MENIAMFSSESVVREDNALLELNEEVVKLRTELRFANQCIHALIAFNAYLNHIRHSFESLLDLKQKQQLMILENDCKQVMRERELHFGEVNREVNAFANDNHCNDDNNDNNDNNSANNYSYVTYESDEHNGEPDKRQLNIITAKTQLIDLENKFIVFSSLEDKYKLITALDSRCHKKESEIAKQFNVTSSYASAIYEERDKWIHAYNNSSHEERIKKEMIVLNRTANKGFDEPLDECSSKTSEISVDETSDRAFQISKRNVDNRSNECKCCRFKEFDCKCKQSDSMTDHVDGIQYRKRHNECTTAECALITAKRDDCPQHRTLKTYKCDICGSLHSTKEHLRQHVSTHDTAKPFACDFESCDYRARNMQLLKEHQRVHNKAEWFSCTFPRCIAKFSRKNSLNEHIKRHLGIPTNNRIYSCDWPACDAQFDRNEKLRLHILSHTGEKPIVCDHPGCDFKTRRRGALKKHKLKHSQTYPFECEWPSCQKKFRDKANMKVHLAQHTGNKPFGCSLCEKSFATKRRLQDHMNIHSGQKTNKCPYLDCDKSFVDAGNMRRHYRIHLKSLNDSTDS